MLGGITVNNFAVLFNCKLVGRGSDSMLAPTESSVFGLLGLDTCLFLGPSGSNWWPSFAPAFQWCF